MVMPGVGVRIWSFGSPYNAIWTAGLEVDEVECGEVNVFELLTGGWKKHYAERADIFVKPGYSVKSVHSAYKSLGKADPLLKIGFPAMMFSRLAYAEKLVQSLWIKSRLAL